MHKKKPPPPGVAVCISNLWNVLCNLFHLPIMQSLGTLAYFVERTPIITATVPILSVCHCAYQHIVVPIPEADIGQTDVDKLTVFFKDCSPLKMVGVEFMEVEPILFALSPQLFATLLFKSNVFGCSVTGTFKSIPFVLSYGHIV